MLIDELYSDTIQITKKLKTFIENLSFHVQQQLPKISYYALDPEFNQKEELYIISIKKGRSQTEDEEPEYMEYMNEYQKFKVGMKEYKLSSELSTYGKFVPQLEKTCMKSNTLSLSNNTVKSSLISNLISPRLSRRIDFQKSHTTPQINNILLGKDKITSAQGMRSARNTELYSQVQRNNGYGLFTTREEVPGNKEVEKAETQRHKPRQGSWNVWPNQAPLSQRHTEGDVDARTRSKSPGKGGFSSLFGRKSKVTGKIAPFIGEGL